eukprot:417545_1
MSQQQENQHESVKLKYQNKSVKVRLPTFDGTPQKILDAIKKKIKNKFKLNIKHYRLSFANTFIDLDDPKQLHEIFLNNKSEITFIVAKNASKSKPQSQAKGSFQFRVIYNETHPMKYRYPFPLDLEQWTDDMLSDLKSRIEKTFKIKTEFLFCEDKKREFDIDDIDDLKTAVEERYKKDKNIEFNSKFIFDLYIKMEQESNTFDNVPDIYTNDNDKQHVDNAPDIYVQNENKNKAHNKEMKDNNDTDAVNEAILDKQDKKINDNKLMSECFSDKINNIMQFHQKIFKKIFNSVRCRINKAEIDSLSELFKNVIDCLNKVKPESEYSQNYLSNNNIKIKILFWQKYAYLCLMTHN